MNFYEKLIELCRAKGVSRSRMADDIGISRSAPTGWSEKNVIPRYDTIKKIADYFGVPVSYFDENVTFADNHGVIGNPHAPITINNASEGCAALSDFEREIVKVCKKLDIKRKNALLSCAYELEQELQGNPS